MKNKELYIPIGIDCSVSHYLRYMGLRYEAFPFDWNVTPITSALSLIKNNFEGFMELENLQFLPPTKRLLFEENDLDVKISNDVITPVVCCRYGMLFPHDFSGDGKKDYTIVKKKYERRIQRLKVAMEMPILKILIFNRCALNDWQLEQYRLAGMEFEENSKNETEIFSEKLPIPIKDIKIMSLSRIKQLI